MAKNWVTQANYSEKHAKSSFKDMREDPESFGMHEVLFEKKTVPDQTVSVKEIMKRYEKGRPVEK